MLFNAKKSTLAVTLAVLMVSGFGALQAFGDDDEQEHEYGQEGREHGEEHSGFTRSDGSRFIANTTFQAECSACHMAYPPGMLPAASWQEMMGTLDQHFGSDASLDEATIAEILPFLEQNALQERKTRRAAPSTAPTDKPVLRITETAWFKDQHDEISATTWKRPSIKSASNCMACHTAADKGNFDEDSVRIPR